MNRLLLLAAVGTLALAQGDADIPARFKDRITPEVYHQLRNEYVNILRGLPADPSLREAAIRQRSLQMTSLPSRFGSVAFVPGAWIPIGPSPIPNGQVVGAIAVSGRVTAFAIDPGNTNKVYLGTAQGGVYRSTDGGTNWTQLFDSATSSAIGALALAPSDATKLFVGTGEANGSGDSYAGVGMYRIDNCDTTATLVGPINPIRNYTDTASAPQSFPFFNGRSISSILVHPTDPSIVFAGIAGGVIGIGGDAPFGGTPPRGLLGVVRLTNATSPAASVVAQKLVVTTAGSLDLPNTGNRVVSSIIFDPGDPNVMLAWVNGNAVANDGGIYRSINAQAANPTFAHVFQTISNGARGEFAIYKETTNPAVVYVATGESSTGRLRRSVDAGATWSGVLAGGQGYCGGQCFYNIGIDVRPGATTATTDDIVVIGGNVAGASTRLFAKSTDGAATFTESSAGLHADTHFIRFAPGSTSVIWHGNDGGVFKSTNGGTTWATLNNNQINTVQFSGLAVHPTSANWAIGGTQDNGTNLRNAAGLWNRVDFGDGGYALIDRNATDTTNITLYHTYFNQTGNLLGFGRILSTACAFDVSGVGLLGWSFKGRYGGTSPDLAPNCDSTDTFNGIPLSDPVLFYAPMEVGPGSPNTVYFGAGAVYRSTDKGETMPAVSQSTGSPVSTIAVSPQDDNYRMFGRRDGSIFYTTTGANPMTALAGIPIRYVARAKFDPSNKNTAYIALGGYFGGTLASQSHVWKITNLNTSPVAVAINTGLPDVPVNAFAVDPANGNNLFAGTDIGVYASDDGGANWAPYGTALPVAAVFGIEIQPTSRTLRIATHGRGMWDIALPPVPPAVVSYRVLFGTQNFNLTGSARTRLPWRPTSIQVGFTSPVNATQPGLTGVATTGISGSGTATVTWTTNPLANGNYSTQLQPTITDLAGNPLALTNQLVRILYGDFNDDGVVNSQDTVLVNAARSQAYNIFADMDGSGVVNVADVNIVRSQIGQTNP